MEKTILDLININKVFDNGFVAVKNFNLQINKGEFVTLLGPSGCGKTTMLKMLAGFEVPTKGKILYRKIDIKNMPVHDRPTSTVFQDYALFPNMTVKQNIEYGLKVMRTDNENISDKSYDDADKVYADAKKLSEKKIKGIKEKTENLEKEIIEVEKEYSKKPEWLKIKDMRIDQFWDAIEILKQELYHEYGEDFLSKQSLKNKINNRINNLFLSLHLKISLDTTSKDMNEIEKKINNLTKNFFLKQLIDKKFDNLNYDYSYIDYDISYWENYPNTAKEKFERKHITRKLNKKEINQRANKIIELVGLKSKENLFPNELSGGMQQRVALARSLVIEPEILLLDEPLSALDAQVRKQLQKELKRLHKELNITFILVTHDQEEALSLSDKVVVMNNGCIEQIGTPNEIYDYPINKWAANFIGKANFFDGIIMPNNKIKILKKILDYAPEYKFEVGTLVDVMIRPEDFDVVLKDEGYINTVVKDIIYKGLLWDIECFNDNQKIAVEGINAVKLNSKIGLKWDIEDMHLIRKVENDK